MISDLKYRLCPPSVLTEDSLPALAQRVTVFGSTRNSVATSPGVSKAWASVEGALMIVNRSVELHWISEAVPLPFTKFPWHECYLYIILL